MFYCIMGNWLFQHVFNRKNFFCQLQKLRNNFSNWIYETLDFWYFSPVKWVNDKTKYPLVIFIHWMWHWHTKRSQINDSYFPYMAWKTIQNEFKAWWAHILLPRIQNYLRRIWKHKKDLQWLIDDYIEKNQKNIDIDKIFIMWASAGGVMAWNLMIHRPHFYKKALIACAPKIPTKKELAKVKNIPIWIVSAKKDPIVPFISQKLTWSILKSNTICKKQCKWTVFPKEVYSPDWKIIKFSHLLAKTITTDFIALNLPNNNKNFSYNSYPWAHTISATWNILLTNWIINRLEG